jgi:23S rRNA pseudouridine1911/1915/1917 synthase
MALNKQHQNGAMKKEYLAVFTGTPAKEARGTWEDYLVKDGKTNTSRVTGKAGSGWRKKRCTVLQRSWTGEKDRGLAKIQLGTGRHHQIRVQMAHHGMPLWADGKYKKKEETAGSRNRGQRSDCVPGDWNLHIQRPGKKMKFEVQPEGVCFREFSEAIKP